MSVLCLPFTCNLMLSIKKSIEKTMLDDVKGSSLHLEDIGGNLDKENLCETECSF